MVLVRRLTVDDAAAYRTIRLEALLDTPESFGSSYEEEVGLPAVADRATTSAETSASAPSTATAISAAPQTSTLAAD